MSNWYDDLMTKWGKVKDLKVEFWVLGPRSAWDRVVIGPFASYQAAEATLRPFEPRSCIQKRSAEGLSAYTRLEQLDEQNKEGQ